MSAARDVRRLPVRLLDGLVGLRRAAGLRRRGPDGDAALAKARRRTGLHDVGGALAEEGIRRLADSLRREAGLSPLGLDAMDAAIRLSMERRLRIVDFLRRRPDVAALPVERPVFVAGLPRTGTTILYRLLALDPGFRPLRYYETREPFADRRRGGEDRRIRRARRSLRVAHWMIPRLAVIHPMGAEDPEECLPLLMRSFASVAWRIFAAVPSYEAWVAALPPESQDEVYRFHRDQLRILRSEGGGEGRWLLKSPAHLMTLHALLRTYPDAVVVRTHRDLTKVLPSAASLLEAARFNLAPDLDPRRLGPELLESVERYRAVLMDPLPPADASRVVDVLYADLVADPVPVVERIRAACGLETTQRHRDDVLAHLAAHPKHAAGVHRYTPEAYGLDGADVLRRTTPYYERYGVPREG